MRERRIWRGPWSSGNFSKCGPGRGLNDRSNQGYAHNVTWDDGNGHSHMRISLPGPSRTIPFVEGTPDLDTWQQVIHVDFDIRPRSREFVMQLSGE